MIQCRFEFFFFVDWMLGFFHPRLKNFTEIIVDQNLKKMIKTKLHLFELLNI